MAIGTVRNSPAQAYTSWKTYLWICLSVKFEKSCEEMVTFELVQTICVANVCLVAEDGRIRVEIWITLNVGFSTQCLE